MKEIQGFLLWLSTYEFLKSVPSLLITTLTLVSIWLGVNRQLRDQFPPSAELRFRQLTISTVVSLFVTIVVLGIYYHIAIDPWRAEVLPAR